jgi:hypothetical protein
MNHPEKRFVVTTMDLDRYCVTPGPVCNSIDIYTEIEALRIANQYVAAGVLMVAMNVAEFFPALNAKQLAANRQDGATWDGWNAGVRANGEAK